MPTSPAAAFETLMQGYYRNTDPELATQALRHFLEIAGTTQPVTASHVTYMFGRIAQLSDQAHARFVAFAQSYQGAQGAILQLIVTSREDPKFPSARSVTVASGEDLDFLWSEFLVSGSREPVLQIIAVLDWPDLVRTRLEAWLNETSWFGRSARRKAAEALGAVGLSVDLERKTVGTDGDLDCEVCQIALRKVPIFKLLPFALSQRELITVTTKSSALWSLRSNAQQHAVVAAVCAEEKSRLGGAARRQLGEAG